MTDTVSLASPREIPFELQSLSEAHRYQRWLADVTIPHMGNRILELGSGIGNLSQHLPRRETLVLSDIDTDLVKILNDRFGAEGQHTQILHLSGLNDPRLKVFQLDTIVSYNVLEHVEDDSRLLRDAAMLLRQSTSSGAKRIVSLVPAHQWAYGKMDEKFGHFRRYDDLSFRRALELAGEKPDRGNYQSFYLNIPALLGWWLSGRVLRRAAIGTGNMRAFEALCPILRPLDNFLHWIRIPAGNSLVTVYEVKNG